MEMNIKQITDYIDTHLAKATKYPSDAKTFMHQAFGALEFYLLGNPEDFNLLEQMWSNTYKPQFEKIIYNKEA